MIKWLKKMLREHAGYEAQVVPGNPVPLPVASVIRPSQQAIPVYPPTDGGIAIATVDEIIESQKEFMARLKILAGGTVEQYEKYYLSIVRNLAAYVQLLPASQTETFIGAGGLFRLCLEMGFYSMQTAEGTLFAGQVVLEERRELEPRWRYATFLAGFCTELYRMVSDMSVTDGQGIVWPKYMKSLTQWAEDEGIHRIFVQWHKGNRVQSLTPGRSDVAIIIGKIIPDYSFSYLDAFSKDIIPVVLAVASGATNKADHQVARIVADTRMKILERDDATKRQSYGRFTVGTHLEPYLLDAMRALVRNGVWKVNEPKSRLWFGQSGLYLIWKSGGKEILNEIANAGIKGAPSDLSTLAEMLCNGNICERNQGQPFYDLKPPDSKDGYQAVKIAKALSILETDDIPMAAITLSTPSAPVVAPKVITPQAEIKVKTASLDAAIPQTQKAKQEPKPKKDPNDGQKDLLSFQPEPPANVGDHDEMPPGFMDSVIPEFDQIPMMADNGLDGNVDSAMPPLFPPQSEQKQIAPNPVPTSQEKPRGKPAKDMDAEIKPVNVVQANFSRFVNEKIGRGLKPEIVEVLGKMIDDFKTGTDKQKIYRVSHGIAFELSQVQTYGLSTERLLSVLHSHEWLVTPDTNKESKLLKVQNPNGDTRTAVVISFAAALTLGFIDET